MITPSFGLTATERVLPKLALDFTTASLDSRVTFTRALNTATRVNSSGLIELVNADTPRFDYTLNTGGACKGLLIEEARTNIAIDSQNPTNWFKAGTATVSGTAQTSPDGTSNAYAISSCEGYANRFSSAGSLNITGGSTITFSIYLKSNGNGTGVAIGLATAGGTYKQQYSVVNITSDWARYSLTMTTNADNTGVFWIVYGNTGTTAFVPWGVQVEAGAFPTSYIPTTTTSLTRNADVATMTGTNFSDWFNASEGTFELDFIQPFAYSGNTYIFACNAATNGERLSFLTESTPRAFWYCAAGGADVAVITAGNITLNQITKQVAAYKLNNYGMAVNGGNAGVDTSGAVPSGLSTLYFGTNVGGGNRWGGWIQKLKFWPQRLLNNELSAFSK